MPSISYRDADLGFTKPGGQTGPFLGGRRPVFDGNLSVVGYRLVAGFAPDVFDDTYGPSGDRFVMDGFDFDPAEVFTDKDVFVTASRHFVVDGVDPEFPPERTVIEVAATAADDQEFFAGCERLRASGYRLAVDASDLLTDRHPLLALCSYVKVDITSLPTPELRSAVKFFQSVRTKVVAYPVDTFQELNTFKQLGFDLFEGYLLSRPVVSHTESLTPNKLNCLRLIEMVCDPESAASDFEELVRTDAGLSLRILHVSGIGPAGGLRRPVRSVSEAVVLLGRDQMYSWLALVLMADASQGPSEQLTIAMTRARMCALIAASVGESDRESAFTVGLLSGINLLLGTEPAELVKKLSITTELIDALLRHEGPLGAILGDVLRWELGAPGLVIQSGASPAQVEDHYLDALRWATGLCANLELERRAA